MTAAANGNSSVMGSRKVKSDCNGQQDGGGTMDKTIGSGQSPADEGTNMGAMLDFGWSVCCEIWTGLSKNIQIHMSTYIGNAYYCLRQNTLPKTLVSFNTKNPHKAV